MTLAELVFFFPVFYIQLYAIKHSLDPTFAFYTVRLPTSSEFHPVVYPVGSSLSADFHIEWQLLLWTTYSRVIRGQTWHRKYVHRVFVDYYNTDLLHARCW